MITLDCKGLACPAPVLQTKKALDRDHPADILITVDNPAAKENVSRFLGSQHYKVTIDQDGKIYRVMGKLGEDTLSDTPPAVQIDTAKKKIMVMIATDTLGRGDDELGGKLMINFIKTLKEMGDELWRLVFVNNGVKLTIQDSSLLPDLKDIERGGTNILVCGTCLDFFNLLEQKKVGETTNMLDVVTAMQLADKVINL